MKKIRHGGAETQSKTISCLFLPQCLCASVANSVFLT